MKKIITIIAVSLVASVALSDITSFKWSGGSASDPVTGSDYVHTFIDDDMTADINAFISGGQINPADLYTFSAFNTQNASIVPAFLPNPNTWETGAINSTDDTLAGKYAWAIVSGSSSIGAIGAGDTFLLTQVDGPIQAGTTPPTATPTAFSPGSTSTITVVPEPATVGLFGLGALSAWIIRRNKQKAIEEEEEI